MNERLKALADVGVSIWLDDLSRGRLTSGNLAEKIQNDSVSGVTTNPTIFAAALSNGADYADQLRDLGPVATGEAIKQLCAQDVRDGCDLFSEVYAASKGYDGRVSIEVEPGLAHETDATIAQAKELHALVGRENVLIKIPATKAGLPAIRAVIGAGISVNVTLIFSKARYLEVMEAYLQGLEDADAAGLDLSKIHSVASFFISRVDSELRWPSPPSTRSSAPTGSPRSRRRVPTSSARCGRRRARRTRRCPTRSTYATWWLPGSSTRCPRPR